MPKILLLEDDASLQEILKECLEEEGFSVISCADALSASAYAYEQSFDLYLFDVMVDGGNGFEILKDMRKDGNNTPTIFITALQQIKDLEAGFMSGCDDYLKKPFELAELLIRIKALLKKRYKGDKIDFGNGYSFEVESEILYFNGNPFKIPTKERELLKLLLQNEGNFVTNEMILKTLWGYDEELNKLSLRVYIKDLRHIVGKENIQTRRGEGYCFKRLVK